MTELPYTARAGGDGEGFLQEVIELARGRRPQVADLGDESDRQGRRILVTPGGEPHEPLGALFEHTSLELTLAVDMVALVDGERAGSRWPC